MKMSEEKMKLILIIATALSLAACAKAPTQIEAIAMPHAYSGVDCRLVASLLKQEQRTLESLEQRQRMAVVGDTAGAAMLGIPIASLARSDVEGPLAVSKSKAAAMKLRTEQCGA
jgi:starvation-inducible outer membrane lipoprotein